MVVRVSSSGLRPTVDVAFALAFSFGVAFALAFSFGLGVKFTFGAAFALALDPSRAGPLSPRRLM